MEEGWGEGGRGGEEDVVVDDHVLLLCTRGRLHVVVHNVFISLIVVVPRLLLLLLLLRQLTCHLALSRPGQESLRFTGVRSIAGAEISLAINLLQSVPLVDLVVQEEATQNHPAFHFPRIIRHVNRCSREEHDDR